MEVQLDTGRENLEIVSEIPAVYVYNKVLTALQSLPGEAVAIDTDSDFEMRGMSADATDPGFTLQIMDSAQVFMSNLPVLWNNYQGIASQPFPWMPGVRYPAGGKIQFDIVDTSGSTNTIQITFFGVRRLLRPRPFCVPQVG